MLDGIRVSETALRENSNLCVAWDEVPQKGGDDSSMCVTTFCNSRPRGRGEMLGDGGCECPINTDDVCNLQWVDILANL